MTTYYQQRPMAGYPHNPGETHNGSHLTAAQITAALANGSLTVWGGGTPRPVEPPRSHQPVSIDRSKYPYSGAF